MYIPNEDLIGRRIKDIRTKKKVTQAKLSEMTGISASAISTYESSRKIPGLTNLAAIAHALGVSMDELYFGNDSERFVTTAADDAEVIVNCIYELWERNYFYKDIDPEDGGWEVRFLREITDSFLDRLEEYKQNCSAYADPGGYLRQIRDNAIVSIRKTWK